MTARDCDDANCLKDLLRTVSMSERKKPEERIVKADDDNVPHLENMANVQGSNKDPKADAKTSDSL